MCTNMEKRDRLDSLLRQLLCQAEQRLCASEVTLRMLLGEGEHAAYLLQYGIEALSPGISQAVAGFIQQDSLVSLLAEQIQDWLNRQTFLGIVSSFVSRERWESLVGKLLQEAGDYMRHEDNSALISKSIYNWLELRFDTPISLWIEGLEEEHRALLREQLQARLIEVLTSEDAHLWFRMAVETLAQQMQGQSMMSILAGAEISFTQEQLADRMQHLVHALLQNSATERYIVDHVSDLLGSLMQRPLLSTMSIVKLSPKVIDAIASALLDAFASRIGDILGLLDISRIVKRRLDEFPMREVEKLTLEIAGRELSVITNLGALLGTLIGMTQLLLMD